MKSKQAIKESDIDPEMVLKRMLKTPPPKKEKAKSEKKPAK